MNIRDLKYFVAAVDLKHFGKAAKKCCVSQPTLSGQIKKLEEELKVNLFERSNRRVVLTESGESLAKIARNILKDVECMREIAQNENNPFEGKFRIGAFPTLAPYIFPKLVPKIRAEFNNLRLVIIEEKTATLLDKLKRGELDAALLALPIEDDFLEYKELFEDEFLLAVPENHELAKHNFIEQKTLKEHPLLLLEEGHCLRDQALDVCRTHDIDNEQDFKATGLETLRYMIKAGTGITFMPKIAALENETDIKYIPFKAPVPSRKIVLAWRKTSQRKMVIDKLTELAGDI